MKEYEYKPLENSPTQSLSRHNSWVIISKETKQPILETWDWKVVEAVNTNKYEAIPILKYLASLNDIQPGGKV